ncbi:hypothetical protein GCM10025858_04390 [Alicyclobacillus sacchari]|nr:hypothetical protein GCM10025858_04390 [Alicyclobacillus sacchari]
MVDRRVVRVQLKPPGAQIIEDVLRARRAYLHTILIHVDVSTRKTILDALELLLTNMANQ